MKVDNARTIGESKSILVGRTMESQKSCLGVYGNASFDRKSGLPVSFRSILALRSSSSGGYDSRRHANPVREIAPA